MCFSASIFSNKVDFKSNKKCSYLHKKVIVGKWSQVVFDLEIHLECGWFLAKNTNKEVQLLNKSKMHIRDLQYHNVFEYIFVKKNQVNFKIISFVFEKAVNIFSCVSLNQCAIAFFGPFP